MKVSLAWLRELVDGRLEADEVVRRLTLGGFEIEAREKFGAMTGVVVARVVARRPHPDAAKLTLVDVDDGSGKTTQVVCGAANVPDAGGLVAWARPGATLPSGMTLGEKPVRGIVSPGMFRCPRLHCVPLHQFVCPFARQSLFDQRQQNRLRVPHPQRQPQISLHVLGIHQQPFHQFRQRREHVIQQDA